MKTIILNRIEPKSLALVWLITNAIVGLIISFTSGINIGKGLAFLFGYTVAGTAMYALIGLVGGYLGAIFYNFAAKKVGGIKLTYNDAKE